MAWPSAVINHTDFAEELWLHEIFWPLSKKFMISTLWNVRCGICQTFSDSTSSSVISLHFPFLFFITTLPHFFFIVLLHSLFSASLQLVFLLFPLPLLLLPHWFPLFLYILSTCNSASLSYLSPLYFLFFDFRILHSPYFSLISLFNLYFLFLISTSICPSSIASSITASSTIFSSSFLLHISFLY